MLSRRAIIARDQPKGRFRALCYLYILDSPGKVNYPLGITFLEGFP